MTEPKVSERMRNLVANVGHTACLYGQSQHDDGLLELSNQADAALLTAIAELEQRAEKAEQERDLLMQEPDNRLDGYRELGAKCAALEERNDVLKSERDKWKRVAVAYQRWENAERIFRAHEFPPPEILRALQNARAKLTSTIADLGPAWNEAVR